MHDGAGDDRTARVDIARHGEADDDRLLSGARHGADMIDEEFERPRDAEAAHPELCRPAAGTAWSRRIRASVTSGASACRACHRLTRTTCRGCSSHLCLDCARRRIHCPIEESAREQVDQTVG